MKLAKGNMWATRADAYVITTNQTVTIAGKVVMGRGAARQARDMWPGLDSHIGNWIRNHHNPRHFPDTVPYYLMYAGLWRWPNPGAGTPTQAERTLPPYAGYIKLYAFQVKNHYRDLARLDLIESAVRMLDNTARRLRPKDSYSLNFPGIGNGGLPRSAVLPLLQVLPDNITVWEL
jgi:hypothetical protein